MMWKEGSCENELFENMKKAEIDSYTKEYNQRYEMISLALDELNQAAVLFEEAGNTSRAAEVINLIHSFASESSVEEEVLEDKNDIKEWNEGKRKSEAKKVFKFFGFNSDDI